MTRTSARKSALNARASLREEDTEGEEDEQESENEAPPPKKRRTSTAAKPPPRPKVKVALEPKVKGALKGFLDLPLELILHIVNELDLPTIFHLSRLSKRF